VKKIWINRDEFVSVPENDFIYLINTEHPPEMRVIEEGFDIDLKYGGSLWRMLRDKLMFWR
jgi:hypothetical protein